MPNDSRPSIFQDDKDFETHQLLMGISSEYPQKWRRMIDFTFVKASFPVKCEAGITADAATGKRIFTEADKGKFKKKKGTGYVNKKTLQPYYTAVNGVGKNKTYVFQIYYADTVNKYGLNWKRIYYAIFTPQKVGAEESGEHDLQYWLCGDGAKMITPNLVYLESRVNENFSAREVYGTTWGEYFPYEYCDCTETEFLQMWYSGKLLDIYENRTNLRRQSFGIELKFTGINRYRAAQVVASFLKGRISDNTEGLYAYRIRDKQHREWKITRDASINAQGYEHLADETNYQCELVSPVCTYEDIPLIQELVRSLRRAGMTVNKSCGIHVHVDDSGHTAASLVRLIKCMASHEELLFDALSVPVYRKEHYCQKTSLLLMYHINQSIQKIDTVSDVKRIWYGSDYGNENEMSSHYHYSRYHALNLHSLWQGKGIEYRMFNSSTHAGRVKAYIQFCLALNQRVKDSAYDAVKPLDRSLSKTEQLKKWLDDLGLVGEEFSTARLHLLSKFKRKDRMVA